MKWPLELANYSHMYIESEHQLTLYVHLLSGCKKNLRLVLLEMSQRKVLIEML